MEIEIGSLLKMDLSSDEVLYFKVVKSETTAVGVKQVCSLKKGDLNWGAGDLPCSYIYKSELGVHYFPVEEAERNLLRKMYKKGE